MEKIKPLKPVLKSCPFLGGQVSAQMLKVFLGPYFLVCRGASQDSAFQLT